MNRLNKIILSFVLPIFCLLISVSYAYEFGSTPIDCSDKSTTDTSISSSVLGISTYTVNELKLIISNYFNDKSNEEYVIAYQNMISTLESEGINIIIFQYTNSKSITYSRYICFTDSDLDVGFIDNLTTSSDEFCFVSKNNITFTLLFWGEGSTYATLNTPDTTPGIMYNAPKIVLDYSSVSIKQLSGTYSSATWDGTSYYYKSPSSDEPATPTLPSNSEIAQAVQSFYNSDYYKNNKDFEDFIVMYNYETKYFDFIGHNFEDKFQQLIFPAGHIYNERWWKFSLDGLTTQVSSYLFNKYYWLYSTNDFGQNIRYEGKGAIKDLLDLRFATSSIIVYSTNEYDVVVYTYDENDEFVSSEMETMPGDQYTYDENLDPTTNEYNPLENFVPTNPSQTILGDVDFNEINKIFEENKDILNIEGASWLFTANNQLTNYFIGFLSLLIVFLIISRILGG